MFVEKHNSSQQNLKKSHTGCHYSFGGGPMAGLGHELYGEQPVRAPHDLHMDLIIGFLSDVYRAIPCRLNYC